VVVVTFGCFGEITVAVGQLVLVKGTLRKTLLAICRNFVQEVIALVLAVCLNFV
jgi:hypothetical protein